MSIQSIIPSREDLIEWVEGGKVNLVEHEGDRGVWATIEGKQVFLAISNYGQSTLDDSGKEYESWAVAHEESPDPHVIIRMDGGSGRITNWEKIKDRLHFEHATDLSEIDDWHKDSHAVTKNDDGTPKVFYHGTRAGAFSKFKPSEGTWVTEHPEISDEFTVNHDPKSQDGGHGGHVYPVHIKMTNPFIPSNERGWLEEYANKHYDHISKMERVGEEYEEEPTRKENIDSFLSLASADETFDILEDPHLMGEIRKRGHDGVRMNEYDKGHTWALLNHNDKNPQIASALSHVLMSEVDLSIPDLQPGDKWVTLKPHGPDSSSYTRVIIREHEDGSAHVVWSGHKGLLNLKLHSVGEEKERRENPKPLSIEEKDQLAKQKEERGKAKTSEREAFGKALAEHLGLEEGQAKEIAEALERKALKVKPHTGEKDPHVERAKREDRNSRIVKGELPEVGSASDSMDLGEALDLLSSGHDDGHAPPSLKNVSPEVKEAWDVVMSDPETAKKVAAMHAQHKDAIRKISKSDMDGQPISMQVGDRMARYADEDDAKETMLKGAKERASYASHSQFWKQASDPALGQGYHDYFMMGAADALTAASDAYSAVGPIDSSLVRMCGPELASAALAQRITDVTGQSKDVANKIERLIGMQSLPTVEASLAATKEIEADMESIRNLPEADGLSSATKVMALKNHAVRRQQALGRAAGSLETAAVIADYLRKGTKNGVVIKAGANIEEVKQKLGAMGISEESYEVGKDKDRVYTATVSEAGLREIGSKMSVASNRNKKSTAIKNHSENTDDFHTPNLVADRNMKGGQQAIVRFVDHEKKVLANAKVGIGKTLTAGATVDHLKDKGELPNGSWYVLPTNLIGSTLKELRSNFPGLNVVAAHGDYNGDASTPEGREALYTAGNDILLIGQDTVRSDASVLAGICQGKKGPSLIIGDEVQAMFTPGADDTPEDQSARSRALMPLQAKRMLAMTGTPLRRASTDVWKVLNWIRPGEFGTAKQWNRKYGGVGIGVSAWSEAANKEFRRAIEHCVITESEAAPVEYRQNLDKIPLSDRQKELYRQAELDHVGRVSQGENARKSLSQKIGEQNKAVFAGDMATNSLLQKCAKDVLRHAQNGERGVIHCTTIDAVKSVVSSFPPGAILAYTGKDDMGRRDQIVSAVNDGTIIKGVRAAGRGSEGVVSDINGGVATLTKDDGSTVDVPVHDLESKVLAVAGTSRAVGVISTGLNLQKGTSYSIHYQLPDSAATYTQRNARNLRTGQTRNVTSYTYLPDLPNQVSRWQRIQQEMAMSRGLEEGVDHLDERGVVGRKQEVIPDQVSLAEERPSHVEGHVYVPRSKALDAASGKALPVESRHLGKGTYVWHDSESSRMPHHTDYYDHASIKGSTEAPLRVLKVSATDLKRPELSRRSINETVVKDYDAVQEIGPSGKPVVTMLLNGGNLSKRKAVTHVKSDEQTVYSRVPYGQTKFEPHEDGDYGAGHYVAHDQGSLRDMAHAGMSFVQAKVDPTSRLLRIPQSEEPLESPELQSRLGPDIESFRSRLKAGDKSAVADAVRQAGYHGVQELDGKGKASRTFLMDGGRVSGQTLLPLKKEDMRDARWNIHQGEPISPFASQLKEPEENIRQRRNQLVSNVDHRMERLQLADEKGRVTVGQKTTDDWFDSIHDHMPDEQIRKAGDWYGEVSNQFKKVYGDKAEKMLAYWMTSQQRTSPQLGLSFVHEADNIARGLDFYKMDKKTGEVERDKDGQPVFKKAGVAHAKLLKLAQGQELESGLGEKLHDFIDSVIGKKYRTYYGDDPEAGQPVAADIWSQRDYGRIDPQTVGRLHDRFANKEVTANGKKAKIVGSHFEEIEDEEGNKRLSPTRLQVHYDDGTAPTEVKHDATGTYSGWHYEQGARYLQKVTEEANKRAWMGKTDWEPRQIQAIGWIGTQAMHGAQQQDADKVWSANIRSTALELTPAEGSPLHAKFGKEFEAIRRKNPAKFERISKAVIDHAVKAAAGATGVTVTKQAHGPGGYLHMVNPSAHVGAIGTPSQVKTFRAVLGHMLGQSEILGFHFHPRGAHSALSFSDKTGAMSNPAVVEQFVKRVADLAHKQGEDHVYQKGEDGRASAMKDASGKAVKEQVKHWLLDEGYSPFHDEHGNHGVTFLNMAYPRYGSDGLPLAPRREPDGSFGDEQPFQSQDYYAGKWKKDQNKVWKPEDIKVLHSAIEQVATEMGLTGKVSYGHKANIESTRHDWSRDSTGESHYPRDLATGARDKLVSSVNSDLIPELHRRVQEELSKEDSPEALRIARDLVPGSGSLESQEIDPLKGLPSDLKGSYVLSETGVPVMPAGLDWVRQSAEAYRAAHGKKFKLDEQVPPPFYHQIDPERAKKLADHFDSLEHSPNDPGVAKAYKALATETQAQWDHMTQKDGIHAEPWSQTGQPYKNSAEMVHDVHHNKHLYYFPSESGFGDDSSVSDHPLMQAGEDGIPHNDKFRAVHDYFGHAANGYQFGPRGEENAWIEHSKMFSEKARPALTAETRLQNNWVNNGAHLRDEEGKIPKKGEKGYVHPMDRPYADQKATVASKEFSDPSEYYRIQGWKPDANVVSSGGKKNV